MARICWIALGIMLVLAAQASARTRRRVVSRAPAPAEQVVISDDFQNGALGWEAGFSDYSPASEGMDLEGGVRMLPPELGIGGTGFMITGNNHSDDLFSFIAKKLTVADGIRPNQLYSISFRILMASNVGDTCSGIGGSPSLSVYLKVGATAQQPRVELGSDNHFAISVDKGNQSVGGSEMSVAGNVANGTHDCGDAPYSTFEREHVHPFAVRSSPGGDLWLIVGTDSGFEGRQTLYYESIEATLEPAR